MKLFNELLPSHLNNHILQEMESSNDTGLISLDLRSTVVTG